MAFGGVRDGPELRRVEAPPHHRHADGIRAALFLRAHTDMVAEGLERRVLRHARRQRESELPLERLLEARLGPAVEQEQKLQPRLLAVLTQYVALAEHFSDAAHHRGHLVRPHEDVEAPCEPRLRRQPAADAEREADLAAARMPYRGEPDVVD